MGQQLNGSELNSAIWQMPVCGEQKDVSDAQGALRARQKLP